MVAAENSSHREYSYDMESTLQYIYFDLQPKLLRAIVRAYVHPYAAVDSQPEKLVMIIPVAANALQRPVSTAT